MTRAEIEAKIVSIVHEQKTLPEPVIPRSTPLAELGIDSLDALNILFELEEHFGISVPDERARQIRTLDDMVDTVEALLPGA